MQTLPGKAHRPHLAIAVLLSLATPTALVAQNAPTTQKSDKAARPIPESTLNEIEEFLLDGKVNLDLRLRWEFADMQKLRRSNAVTARTRLGYTTKKWHGAQLAMQFEDNRAFGSKNYNAAGLNGRPGRTVIADPQDTELNQFYVDYHFKELDEELPVFARVGRQRIILNDARFVGNVGWRQLEQTYDAALLQVEASPKLTATYAYVWHVNRIFGASSGRNLDVQTHVVDVAYTGLPIGKLVGFAYLIDIEGAAKASTQTYGVRLTGKQDFDDEHAVKYAGSVAFQSDYANNPNSFDALYVAAEGKFVWKDEGVFVGPGFELLGSDSSKAAFATPLATLHKFNGFADAFLATPIIGLRDYYLTAGAAVPGSKKSKLLATFHYFTGDDKSTELGQEIDLVAIHPLSKRTKLLAKYANFNATRKGGLRDIQRFWLQLAFSF